MTYERLKHYKDQPLILMELLSMAGLSSADCHLRGAELHLMLNSRCFTLFGANGFPAT